jgi:hypothetical protein
VHHYRLDAHFTARTLDAQCDFATICNENFLKHKRLALCRRQLGVIVCYAGISAAPLGAGCEINQ